MARVVSSGQVGSGNSMHRPFVALVAVYALAATALSWMHQTTLVRGVIEASGRRLSGATVGLQTHSPRVLSDANGCFEISVPQSDPTLKIAAWKQGYFIAAAPIGSQVLLELNPITKGDNPLYRWIDPNPDPDGAQNCANCHPDIYRQWTSSQHARSALNPRFLDLFYGTSSEASGIAGWGFIQDHQEARSVCAACHFPSATPGSDATANPRALTGIDREGIHCDFCHKIADVDLAAVGLDHGRNAMDLCRPAEGSQVFFGPLDDVDRGRDTFAAFYQSSRYCASCHEGILFGTPTYTTYSEWLETSFAHQGVQCQECHMQPDGSRNMALGHGGLERPPSSLSTHSFAPPDRAGRLTDSIELHWTADFDESGIAVQTSLRAPGVGHRFPTGLPQRHLILLVQATDAEDRELALWDGPVVSAAGGTGNSDGDLAGRPGEVFARLLASVDGTMPQPFWRDVEIRKDNRLHPDRTQVSKFRFGAKGLSNVRVRVRILYRRYYKAVIDSKGWNEPDLVVYDQRRVVTRK